MKSMRPDYKNWVPKGMLYGLIAGTAVILVFWILFGIAGIGTAGTLKTVLGHHLLGGLPLQLVLL